jgi:two-component system chemotaxis sensor kinase CheA
MSDQGDNDEIIREFLVESYENLDQLDRDLIVLEEDPSNRDGLASVFRTIHTIKGTCGFLGFGKLEGVAHVGENLLSRLRDGKIGLTTDRTSALLAMVDAIRTMLASVETMGTDGDNRYVELVETLTRLQDDDGAGEVVLLTELATDVEAEAAPPLPTGTEPAAPALVEVPPPAPVETPEARTVPETTPAVPTDVTDIRGGTVSETNIRVDVSLLDKLMNLAGELVLARNQILQYAATQSDTAFIATSQRLNLITTELQEGVMKTRMQPIGNVWSKFPRVVRDLAVTCGKQVRIEMEGEETELDKTIIEAIKDPLTHVVRNSVDHGIETPEMRIAAGKASEGRLLLRAYHEGGQVNIEITDDGKGIDPERLKEKALQRGLITPEQAGRMGEREALNLIFLPGFSTAEKVTNVSGRGVGMDVVKTNIERIGGTVDVQSRPGEGTTLRVKIPLTLAIIPALIVTSGGGRYSIPQVSLLELVRLEGDEARKGVEMIHGAPVYRLRGELLPLVYLDHELNGERAASDDHDGAVNIVVLQAEDRHFGLVVEGINDTEEIVVKPLSKQLKGITTFAGATIMGDGKVALILDVLGLAQRSNVVSAVRERKLAEQGDRAPEQADQRQTLLLFGIGEDGRMAIPLSMVARLEEFARTAVERAANQEVVQYRGQIMPLVRLSSALGQGSTVAAAQELIQVVVYSENGRSIGLVVDRILDIVEERITINRAVGRDGILGSAVVQQRVTDLLDVQGVIRSVDPTFFAPAAA